MQHNKIYVYPKLSKSGLGNLLWMWAKAVCWASDHQVPVLKPRWVYWSWGRFLRKDSDKRRYCGFFLSDGSIGGWARLWRLMTYRRVLPNEYRDGMRRCLVTFSELGDFTPLIGRHEQVRDAFYRIVLPSHLPSEEVFPDRYIALHVRMGDFSPYVATALESGETNMRIPVEWYREALQSCRKQIGSDIPAVVFSDGTDGDLAMLLDEPNISRSQGHSALEDLVALSRADLLIASRSSFSLWAAYVGQMPVIYYRGCRPWHEPVVHPTEGGGWECEWKVGEAFPKSFAERLR